MKKLLTIALALVLVCALATASAATNIFSILITANGSIEHTCHNGQNSDNRQ